MADNVAITAGTGTTIAADEVTRNATSEKQQLVKLAFGIDGTYDGMAAETTPLPVKQGVGTEASWVTMSSIAFGSLTTSFQALVTPAGNAKAFDIYNNTDALLILSMNAGTNEHSILPAKTGKIISLAELGLKGSANVHVKYSGTAPTEGSVYGTAVK